MLASEVRFALASETHAQPSMSLQGSPIRTIREAAGVAARKFRNESKSNATSSPEDVSAVRCEPAARGSEEIRCFLDCPLALPGRSPRVLPDRILADRNRFVALVAEESALDLSGLLARTEFSGQKRLNP